MKFPPQLLLVLATLLWGGNFVIGRAVAGDIPPITLAFLRWCVAFIIFLPLGPFGQWCSHDRQIDCRKGGLYVNCRIRNLQ